MKMAGQVPTSCPYSNFHWAHQARALVNPFVRLSGLMELVGGVDFMQRYTNEDMNKSIL